MMYDEMKGIRDLACLCASTSPLPPPIGDTEGELRSSSLACSLLLLLFPFDPSERSSPSCSTSMANALGLASSSARSFQERKLDPWAFRRFESRRTLRGCFCAAVDGGVLGAVALGSSQRQRVVGLGSKLVGSGSAVPKLTISNNDLAQIVETSDEWISVRTGIRNRRVLTGNETLGGLAVEAAKGALLMAEVEADVVDLVILCTSTPDDLFGGGSQIQRDLGCKNAWAFDITAACSGFVVGLITATRFIKGGGFQNILVIGADALSRNVDWTDRGTCILFGDAAGAVLVQACNSEEDGLLGFDVHSDGNGQRQLNALVTCDHAGESNGARLFPPKRSSYSCIQMNGQEVFRFAVRCVPQSIEAALEEAGIPSSSVDWLLLHQANQRIIDAVATRLEIPNEKIISNLANYGNTSAASIPLALDEAVRSGKVQAGNTIATAGFGAGLTWGSAIVRWR